MSVKGQSCHPACPSGDTIQESHSSHLLLLERYSCLATAVRRSSLAASRSLAASEDLHLFAATHKALPPTDRTEMTHLCLPNRVWPRKDDTNHSVPGLMGLICNLDVVWTFKNLGTLHDSHYRILCVRWICENNTKAVTLDGYTGRRDREKQPHAQRVTWFHLSENKMVR
ncbi:Uncharacterized protein DAT39_017931 [Clarias magur]|uniref:Uncharacterized protein n=1 Tax=Clarias magur TaxID=1594786 RepID=A0A8J4TKL2_CLAMG|nr:Uncharacterized protein DAT39_017931 [Clarias magur]